MRRRFLLTLFTFGLLLLAQTPQAAACGWWGDGEASDSDDAVEVDAQGRTKSQDPAATTMMKIPHAMGFGIAIKSANTAVPYLQATDGLAVNDIAKLAKLGFSAVIDIGTSRKTAELHRRETEALGMRYFNRPDVAGKLTPADVRWFSQIVTRRTNLPLLVFAHSRSLLGKVWARFRFAQGADERTALAEGRRLGLSAGDRISEPLTN